MSKINGWLFDAYPINNNMILWIKTDDNNHGIARIEDSWNHSIYIASDTKSNLKSILQQDQIIASYVKDFEFVTKYERITDTSKSQVLKLTLKDSTKALTLARKIEQLGNEFGKFRLYNVDVLPAQSYFYEHDIFPLGYFNINSTKNNRPEWYNDYDSVWSTDYKLPNLRIIKVKVTPVRRTGRVAKLTDRLDSIVIEDPDSDEGKVEIKSDSEADIIFEFMREVEYRDADFIFTYDGDSFTFPYLIQRAAVNNINLVLGRESIPLKEKKKEGTSYFSYGRIYFKPNTVKLLGRIHIDTDNSFVLNESGLHGLYEITRICRMPLHTASRASIGKCLSSLQFYNATKKEILIPWKPTLTEHFKTYKELLMADRGGLIYEPEIGVHEKVAEFDFASLYPNIMYKKNISAETVICSCCSRIKQRVPELDRYYICKEKTGIVPTSLEIILTKREQYKRLKNSTNNSKLKEIYNARQNALKWILVTSFGYLGFNNAKFGRIDAHIAVCAYDRDILIKSIRIVEQHGFRVLHGIVDSLWVQKNDVQDNNHADYAKLGACIGEKTGFDISFEGIYKWIVFVPSKLNPSLSVPNRYFGVFEDGIVKMRGIEARRHDTPEFLSKFQQYILQIMAQGNTIMEVRELMPTVRRVLQQYVKILKEGKVELDELVFSKRVSKDFNEYEERNTVENNAIQLLCSGGKQLKAGQILRYVISDYYNKYSTRRTTPIELITNKTTYDVKRYIELLIETCYSITRPFGFIPSISN